MDGIIRIGGISGIYTIVLSVPVIIVDQFDILNIVGDLHVNYWILFIVFFIPYLFYGFTYAVFAYGFAMLGKKYDLPILTLAFYALAIAFIANELLGFPVLGLDALAKLVEPGSTSEVVRGALLCISSASLLKLQPQVGRLIIWTSVAGIVSGLALVFSVGDFPMIVFLALGSTTLFQASG